MTLRGRSVDPTTGVRRFNGRTTSLETRNNGSLVVVSDGSQSTKYTALSGHLANYQSKPHNNALSKPMSTAPHSNFAGKNFSSHASVSHGSRTITENEAQYRVVNFRSRVDESKTHVIGEKIIEHAFTVPKRIVHEDIIEKVIVIPETIRREELIDEVQIVKERIIEVAKSIINEKTIEVPEFVYVDKIVEVPEVIVQENVREVPKIEYQERIHEIPKIMTQEKVVEIPEIEYREYIVEKVVEVPEVHEQIVTKQIPVPQYIDKPIPEYVDVEVPYDVPRNIPIPVEVTSTFEYKLPKFKSRVNKITYPIYIPRFIETPIAEELLNKSLQNELEVNCNQIGLLGTMEQAVSLCEIENLAMEVRAVDIKTSNSSRNFLNAIKEAWAKGTITIQ